jgi:hypothetical protein
MRLAHAYERYGYAAADQDFTEQLRHQREIEKLERIEILLMKVMPKSAAPVAKSPAKPETQSRWTAAQRQAQADLEARFDRTSKQTQADWEQAQSDEAAEVFQRYRDQEFDRKK